MHCIKLEVTSAVDNDLTDQEIPFFIVYHEDRAFKLLY
jgi:hypothetical protein